MPPMRAGDLRELDDLGGRRERARHVEQPGAQAERAVLHPLAHEPAHLLDLGGGRLAVDRADHLVAHRLRALADEQPKFGVTRVAATRSSNGLIGSGDDPSGPSISVVTPCRT